MTTKTSRVRPLWDALRKREALEQAERRERRHRDGKVRLAPKFLTHLRGVSNV